MNVCFCYGIVDHITRDYELKVQDDKLNFGIIRGPQINPRYRGGMGKLQTVEPHAKITVTDTILDDSRTTIHNRKHAIKKKEGDDYALKGKAL
ncbi:conserved hypothetical protein [Ricinus communis]|uniref:Uncharacterized protein n=1 Tax=Ricinus communis TaxID=3988 RepID=B9RX02_RICCO|nr:conserved hypothetical protein [Ricinus communis]